MALIDKMKAQASQLAQKAQEAGKAGQAKLGDVQAKRKADAMLHELGAAVFAQRTGRATADTDKDIERLLADLSAYESENGPVDAAQPEAPDAAPASAPDAAPTSAPETPETPEGGFKL